MLAHISANYRWAKMASGACMLVLLNISVNKLCEFILLLF